MTSRQKKLFLQIIPLSLPLLVLVGHQIRGLGEYLAMAFIFLMLPALDVLFGNDLSNPSEEELRNLKGNGWYMLPALAWLPIQIAVLGWALQITATDGLSWFELAGLTLSVGGLTGALGITIGHELGHRLEPVAKFASTLMLWTVGYLHFQIEHNKGHHSRVGTDADPASARRNQSLYAFIPQTVFGGVASAWKFETNDLAKRGRGAWHPSNRVLISLAAWPVLAVAGFAFAGWQGVVLMMGQAVFAIFLLEAVNYVEHYGLRRRALPDGGFERFNRNHAWDSPRRFTNIILFNLQRHSHHHQDVLREWQGLEFDNDGPVLPASYPAMIVVALIPPLFRALIHPRLDAVG